jgi:hypothetical protein
MCASVGFQPTFRVRPDFNPGLSVPFRIRAGFQSWPVGKFPYVDREDAQRPENSEICQISEFWDAGPRKNQQYLSILASRQGTKTMTQTPDRPMSASITRPLAGPCAVPSGYTPVYNTIFDLIMPTLSGNGFKILLVALRQTSGWADESSPTGRKLFDEISYSQFLAKSGIPGKSTLSRAIKECLAAGYLIRRRNGKGYLYSLNASFEINGPESGHTKESIKQTWW